MAGWPERLDSCSAVVVFFPSGRDAYHAEIAWWWFRRTGWNPCEEGIEVKVNFICCHWKWTVLGGISILQHCMDFCWVSLWLVRFWIPRFPSGNLFEWTTTLEKNGSEFREIHVTFFSGSGLRDVVSWLFNMKDLHRICCRLCSITRFFNGLNHQLQHHLIMEFNPAPSVPKSFTLRQWKKVVTVTSHWIITIPI